MNKEHDDNQACGLELMGGLNGIDYKQKFVRAERHDYPNKAPSKGKELPNSKAMHITLHA